MQSQTIPFTYSIKQKSTGKWYYGVKYADNQTPECLGITYFSSSKTVKDLIKIYGIDDFEFKVRKIFSDKLLAIQHESKFLKRVCRYKKLRLKFLNKTYGAPAFWPIMYGDLNPSKRPEIKHRLSIGAKNRTKETLFKIGKNGSATKLKKNILFLLSKIKPHRKSLSIQTIIDNKITNLAMVSRHIDFLKNHKKCYNNIINLYKKIFELIISIPNKPYPKNRKPKVMSPEASKLKGEKIRETKLGKVYAKNIFTNETKMVKIEEIGDIWKKEKMHTEEALIKISNTAKNCSDETREKISESVKRSRSNSKYYTSPDKSYYKSFKDNEIVPDGWLPGIKVESRNNNIGENNRWSKKDKK